MSDKHENLLNLSMMTHCREDGNLDVKRAEAMALCNSVENFLSKVQNNGGSVQKPSVSSIRAKSIRWVDDVDHESELPTSLPNLQEYPSAKPESSIKGTSLDSSPLSHGPKHSIRLIRKTSVEKPRRLRSITGANNAIRKKSLDSSDDFTGSTSSISLSETENNSYDESSVSSSSTVGRTCHVRWTEFHDAQNVHYPNERVDFDDANHNFCTRATRNIGSWDSSMNESWADDSFMETNQFHDFRRKRGTVAYKKSSYSGFRKEESSCSLTTTRKEDVQPRMLFPPPPPPRPPRSSMRKLASFDSNSSDTRLPSTTHHRSTSGSRSRVGGKSFSQSSPKHPKTSGIITTCTSKPNAAEYDNCLQGNRCKKSASKECSTKDRGKFGYTSTSILRKRTESYRYNLSSSLTDILKVHDKNDGDQKHSASCHEFENSDGKGPSFSDLTSAARQHSIGWIVKDMPFKTLMGPGRYSGEVNNFSIPTGKGKIVFDNGNVYVGQWKNGNPVELSS